jgi:hypothetical protein
MTENVVGTSWSLWCPVVPCGLRCVISVLRSYPELQVDAGTTDYRMRDGKTRVPALIR